MIRKVFVQLLTLTCLVASPVCSEEGNLKEHLPAEWNNIPEMQVAIPAHYYPIQLSPATLCWVGNEQDEQLLLKGRSAGRIKEPIISMQPNHPSYRIKKLEDGAFKLLTRDGREMTRVIKKTVRGTLRPLSWGEDSPAFILTTGKGRVRHMRKCEVRAIVLRNKSDDTPIFFGVFFSNRTKEKKSEGEVIWKRFANESRVI